MISTFATLAFSGLLATSPGTLAFQRDYTEARQLGRERAKPLAVFIGSGETGWEKVCRDKMEGTVEKLLAENYVCVYVNREEERGKQLARDFEAADGPCLIISNRKGDLQAFRHSGEMSNDVLAQRLQRYADENRVMETTETITPARTSFYPPPAQIRYQSYYPPSFGGGCAGGSCR